MDAIFFIVCLCAVVVTAGVLFKIFYRKRVDGDDAPFVRGQPQPLKLPIAGGYAGKLSEAAEGRFFEDGAVTDSYQNLKERLFVLLETEKIYLSPEVRITDVARRLSTSETQLSKVIKLKTGKNFCQLIHCFRVREAMRLFSLNTELSITELREMVGFKSQTTFNTAFGRSTGYTPAEWCREYLRKNRMTEDVSQGRH